MDSWIVFSKFIPDAWISNVLLADILSFCAARLDTFKCVLYTLVSCFILIISPSRFYYSILIFIKKKNFNYSFQNNSLAKPIRVLYFLNFIF